MGGQSETETADHLALKEFKEKKQWDKLAGTKTKLRVNTRDEKSVLWGESPFSKVNNDLELSEEITPVSVALELPKKLDTHVSYREAEEIVIKMQPVKWK